VANCKSSKRICEMRFS